MKSPSLHIIDLCALSMKTEGTHTFTEKMNAFVLNYWDIMFTSNQDLVGTDSFEDGAGRSGWENTMDEQEGECLLLLWSPPPRHAQCSPLALNVFIKSGHKQLWLTFSCLLSCHHSRSLLFTQRHTAKPLRSHLEHINSHSERRATASMN